MNNLENFIVGLPGKEECRKYDVYPMSIQNILDSYVFMVKGTEEDFLVSTGAIQEQFIGERIIGKSFQYTISKLSFENGETLRKLFPFTKPIPVLGYERSFGLGDRLGLAGVGHLRIAREYDMYPVLAQQSIRELALTERTYKDVLDAASFAVFKVGYTDGFGADGDHLKTFEEVEMALNLGFTMITLDCSEHIDNSILSLSDEEVNSKLQLSDYYKDRYLNQTFIIEGNELRFSEIELKRIVLTYAEAMDFAKEVFLRYFDKKEVTANFEISIDETSTPTTPNQHYFVAKELKSKGVLVDTLAPRFCGEFQKGVDYIGDINQFELELALHSSIAREFGYKLSIHSGSDKFSIFSLIGKYTMGRFHVKTAGTNWLEAMKIIAMVDPAFYRELHTYALSRFEDATKFYHVTTNIDNIPDVNKLKDKDLPSLFDLNDARQLIHITYGFILSDTNENGQYKFKNKLYQLWHENEELYAKSLYDHIGKHLELLYKGFERNDS